MQGVGSGREIAHDCLTLVRTKHRTAGKMRDTVINNNGVHAIIMCSLIKPITYKQNLIEGEKG